MTERDEFYSVRDSRQTFHHLDGLWLPKMVDERLVEAAKLAQRTAGPTGPREDGNAWPKFQREFLDWYDEIKDEFGNIIGHIQTGEPEKKMPYIPARKISQMEAAIQWPMHYLKEHDGPRNVLSVYLRCKAYRKPFGQACKRLGWPRATAYRARDKALSLIAQGLNSDGIPLD